MVQTTAVQISFPDEKGGEGGIAATIFLSPTGQGGIYPPSDQEEGSKRGWNSEASTGSYGSQEALTMDLAQTAAHLHTQAVSC